MKATNQMLDLNSKSFCLQIVHHDIHKLSLNSYPQFQNVYSTNCSITKSNGELMKFEGEVQDLRQSTKLHHCVKNCPGTEFFWSVFSRIWTECRDLQSKCPYLVRIRENPDQNEKSIAKIKHTNVWLLTRKSPSRIVEI